MFEPRRGGTESCAIIMMSAGFGLCLVFWYPRELQDPKVVLICLLQIPQWHHAFAWTQNRQNVIAMPRQQYDIMSLRSNASFSNRLIGFGAYSEGAAADFNMMLWSYLSSGRVCRDVLMYGIIIATVYEFGVLVLLHL